MKKKKQTKTLIQHFYKGFSGYKPRRNVDSPAQNLFYLVIRGGHVLFFKVFHRPVTGV